MHIGLLSENEIVTSFLKRNNNSVYTFCWLALIGDEYCICEQYFVVKDNQLYEINHDQTFSSAQLELGNLHKLRYYGEYSSNTKYMWNNYYVTIDALKSVAKKSFNEEEIINETKVFGV